MFKISKRFSSKIWSLFLLASLAFLFSSAARTERPSAAMPVEEELDIRFLVERADLLWFQRLDLSKLKGSISFYERALRQDPEDINLLITLARGSYLLADSYLTDKPELQQETYRSGALYGQRAMLINPEFKKKIEAGEKKIDALEVLGKGYIGAIYWTAANLDRLNEKVEEGRGEKSGQEVQGNPGNPENPGNPGKSLDPPEEVKEEAKEAQEEKTNKKAEKEAKEEKVDKKAEKEAKKEAKRKAKEEKAKKKAEEKAKKKAEKKAKKEAEKKAKKEAKRKAKEEKARKKAEEKARKEAKKKGKKEVEERPIKLIFHKSDVRAMMERVLELDETYFYGAAHRYLGAYYAITPESKGGSDKKAAEHFEKALAVEPNFFETRIMRAETLYIKKKDKKLYKSDLNYVIKQPSDIIPDVEPEQILARAKAEKLLKEAEKKK